MTICLHAKVWNRSVQIIIFCHFKINQYCDIQYRIKKIIWASLSLVKALLDKSLLGPKSPWTFVSLDQGLLGQMSLGQMWQHQYFHLTFNIVELLTVFLGIMEILNYRNFENKISVRLSKHFFHKLNYFLNMFAAIQYPNW